MKYSILLCLTIFITVKAVTFHCNLQVFGVVADPCIDLFIVSLDCKLTRLSVGIFSELRILIKIYLSIYLYGRYDRL